MKVGDYVYSTALRQKAVIIYIDMLSDIGSYPDVYVIKMCRTEEEVETVEKFLRYWPINRGRYQR